ncbi:hypothetical protein CVV67_10570 [Arthrobacter stackebrandtii]|nr:hypothetical protein CVV67_10570 [Arthrobacter stackebrandtii]
MPATKSRGIEYGVGAETARRLIPIDALCKHAVWAAKFYAWPLTWSPTACKMLTPEEKAQLSRVELQPLWPQGS